MRPADDRILEQIKTMLSDRHTIDREICRGDTALLHLAGLLSDCLWLRDFHQADGVRWPVTPRRKRIR